MDLQYKKITYSTINNNEYNQINIEITVNNKYCVGCNVLKKYF